MKILIHLKIKFKNLFKLILNIFNLIYLEKKYEHRNKKNYIASS